MSDDDALLGARALVLRDLGVRGEDSPTAVSEVDEVLTERRWWVQQWPAGREHVASQVVQDVQERMLDGHGVRWPLCRSCPDPEPHELRVEPELGPEPWWVCERANLWVAAVGALDR